MMSTEAGNLNTNLKGQRFDVRVYGGCGKGGPIVPPCI